MEIHSQKSLCEDIDLIVMVKVLWSYRWLSFIIIFISTSFAGVYCYVVPSLYNAQAVIAPIADNNQSSLFGGLGGLAGLAGVVPRISSGDNNLAIMKSVTFMKYFSEKRGIFNILYEGCWNKNKGQNIDMRNQTSRCPEKKPGLLKQAEILRDMMKIVDDKKTGVITISFTFSDPEKAAYVVNNFVDEINEYLKIKAKTKIENNIIFLTRELLETKEIEIKNVLYSMLEKEIKSKKLVGGNIEFAFETIDRAYIPTNKVFPKTTKTLAIALFLGILLSLLVIFILFANKASKHK